jgi:methionyl-tRNA formyltransferase
MKLIFMGSCEFSLSVLSILGQHYSFQAVFTAPARPKGRGHKLQTTCVQDYAETKGWPVYTPSSLREKGSQEVLRSFAPDVIIVASYGLLLPRDVLEIPVKGCVNVHPSLLPRWRGASPIIYPILKGDPQTGVSLMVMDEGMDTGPLFFKESIPLAEMITAPELSRLLAEVAAHALVDLLPLYVQGKVTPTSQPDQGITYAPKIKKQEGLLSWHEPAQDLERKIRALTPWPGTWGMVEKKRLFVLSAQVGAIKGGEYEVGTLLPWEKGMAIVCGDHSLLIPTKVRTEEGKTMDSASFVRGYLPAL